MTLTIFRPRRRASGDAAHRAVRALDRLVEDADAPGTGLACLPAEQRAVVLAARREVSALATELAERGDDCEPAAVAIAAKLGRQGVLSLFTAAGARRTLEDARAARALLRRPLEEAS
jgi:hypothetical protein